MGLGNLYEVLVQYLLIKRMTFHSHWDRFPMMSALVCMLTHWIGPIMNHDIGYWAT